MIKHLKNSLTLVFSLTAALCSHQAFSATHKFSVMSGLNMRGVVLPLQIRDKSNAFENTHEYRKSYDSDGTFGWGLDYTLLLESGWELGASFLYSSGSKSDSIPGVGGWTGSTTPAFFMTHGWLSSTAYRDSVQSFDSDYSHMRVSVEALKYFSPVKIDAMTISIGYGLRLSYMNFDMSINHKGAGGNTLVKTEDTRILYSGTIIGMLDFKYDFNNGYKFISKLGLAAPLNFG